MQTKTGATEKAAVEAKSLYRIFLRGRMSAEEILALIGIQKSQRQILVETGTLFSPHIEYRRQVQQKFLALVRSGKTIRAPQKYLGRRRRFKPVRRGARYGRLRALRRGQPGRWIFRCDCGTAKEISVANILYGRGTKSCGCLTAQRRWPKGRAARIALR
jgi:hypothetical protein